MYFADKLLRSFLCVCVCVLVYVSRLIEIRQPFRLIDMDKELVTCEQGPTCVLGEVTYRWEVGELNQLTTRNGGHVLSPSFTELTTDTTWHLALYPNGNHLINQVSVIFNDCKLFAG